MKRIVLAAALVALGSASALAADLPPRGYDKAPAMAAAATNWSGFEADIQGSGIERSRWSSFFNTEVYAFIPGNFLSTEQKLSWLGTVRGRLGAAVTPDLLLYTTGGLAYGHVDASANTFFNSDLQFP